MLALFLLLALLLVLVGHAFRLLRWEQFIRIYERPPRGQMLRGMAGGYALNLCCRSIWAMPSARSTRAAG